MLMLLPLAMHLPIFVLRISLNLVVVQLLALLTVNLTILEGLGLVYLLHHLHYHTVQVVLCRISIIPVIAQL
jgi:hypothetical protein